MLRGFAIYASRKQPIFTLGEKGYAGAVIAMSGTPESKLLSKLFAR